MARLSAYRAARMLRFLADGIALAKQQHTPGDMVGNCTIARMELTLQWLAEAACQEVEVETSPIRDEPIRALPAVLANFPGVPMAAAEAP